MRLIGLAVGLSVGLTLEPLATQAQQAGKLHRVGILTGSVNVANVEAFRQGLRDLGYREDTDVVILHSDVEGRFDRLDAADGAASPSRGERMRTEPELRCPSSSRRSSLLVRADYVIE